MKRAVLFLALCGCGAASRQERVAIPGTDVAFDLVLVPSHGQIPGFWMGAREVTWAEFNRFYEFPGDQDRDGVTRPSSGKDYLALSGLVNEFMLPERPLTSVRYHSAVAYCEWLSKRTGAVYRLPTGTEWTLALQPEAMNVGWTEKNSDERTHVGGEKPPNALGLHDMIGNVWEYVLEPARPPEFEPVIRGGAWNTPAIDRDTALPDWSLADPNRPFSTWWFRGGYSQGFRVVRVGEPAGKAARDAYAAKLDVRGMTGADHDFKVGKSVSMFTRVTGTLRNAGDRALDEVVLKVYYLDPKKKPHLEDRANTLTRRATFNLAFPVLVSSAHEGPHLQPLLPGESRDFTVDIPMSFDPDEDVDLQHYGASVVSLRFTP